MNRVAIGQQVADDLFAAEACIDEAYAALGRFAQTLSVSRRAMKLSATVGNPAFSAVAAAFGQIAAARAELALAHAELARVQKRIGLDTVDFGGLEKPPAASAETETRTGLLRVAKG